MWNRDQIGRDKATGRDRETAWLGRQSGLRNIAAELLGWAVWPSLIVIVLWVFGLI
jgi:hypothetical protein